MFKWTTIYNIYSNKSPVKHHKNFLGGGGTLGSDVTLNLVGVFVIV